jgi:hypothetical protein
MTSDAHAPTADMPRPGDVVAVSGREAVFLYRHGAAAVIRYAGEEDARVVPFAKLTWRERLGVAVLRRLIERGERRDDLGFRLLHRV